MSSPAIILVRPQEEGNVGAVARAMANMGLQRLILVEPAPPIEGVARGFGVGGWEILDQAQRFGSFSEAIAPFCRLVATASGRQRPLSGHRVIEPRRLPDFLASDPAGTETALIFGPEDNGLSRSEIERCEPVVTVPCDLAHPTLNLAQTVLILAYELRVARLDTDNRAAPDEDREPLASAEEIEALEGLLSEILPRIGFDHPPIHAGLLRDLRRLVIRAEPSSWESRVLRRLGNRALRRLANP